MSTFNEINYVLSHAVMDMNGGGASLTGDYINMSKCEEVELIMAFGDGTAAHDLNLTFYEATSAAGAGAQVLDVIQTGMILTQHAADYATYAALTTSWTKETQGTAAETWTDADNGEACGITRIRIRRDQLSDGFTHIRADLADPTAAKVACLLWACKMVRPDNPATIDNPMV